MADKRRARFGQRGGNLTPAQAKKILAAPCYAILSEQAVPIYPGTSLAAPSGLVGIFGLPGFSCKILPGGRAMYLPVWVNDKQWETAVVPVLQDPRWQNTNLLFQALATNNLNLVLESLGNALAQSFHDAGYGPLPAT